MMGLILPLLLFLLEDTLSAPYGGWRQKEGFGNTGNTFPEPNPNAIFGYDYFNLFDDWTTYGSVYNPHKNRTLLLYRRPKKHVTSPVLSKATETQYTKPLTDDEEGSKESAQPLAQYNADPDKNDALDNIESRFQKIFKYFK